MERVASDSKGPDPPIWEVYSKILRSAENRAVKFERVERFAFYERAKHAFAVVATGESAQYANLILKKGVIVPSKPHPAPVSASNTAAALASASAATAAAAGAASAATAAAAGAATAAAPASATAPAK
jgi:hypothetical protein